MRCRVRECGEVEFFDISLGLRKMVERCRYDLGYFCKEFLGDSFDYEFTGQHRELLGLLDDDRIARLAVCGWRGFGKTTIFSAYVIRNMIYRLNKFVVYVGSGLEQAIRITEGIKIELCNNDRILDVFGSYRGVYDVDNVKLGFSKKAYYLHCPYSGEVLGYILPKGAGQSVRGMNVHIGNRRMRPDLVCVDDVETDEDVRSDSVLIGTRVWFYGALMKSIDTKKEPIGNRWTGDSHWRVVVIDTKKHDNSLISYLKRDKQFEYIEFPIARRVSIDDGGVEVMGEYWRSNIPEWKDDKQVGEEIRIAKQNGTWDIYRREMLCESSDLVEDRIYEDDFRYYDNDEVVKGLDCFILVDPARTITGSSRTALTVIYLDVGRGKIYISEQIADRFPVEKQIEIYRNYIRKYKPSVFVIETIGADDFLRNMIESNVLVGNDNVMPLYLRPFRINVKEVRATDLIRLYKSGNIYHHIRMRNSELERNLILFPNCSNWDVIDSAGFIVDTMNKLNIELGISKVYNNDIIEVDKEMVKSDKYRFRMLMWT